MTESTGDVAGVTPGAPIPLTTPKPMSPAALVAAGILLSRIVGLVRERVFGFYFGVTDEADAFRAAFRIPNLLQNLFGEGVLSASFIPVYASLVADGDQDEREASGWSILNSANSWRRWCSVLWRTTRYSKARRALRAMGPGRFFSPA